MSRGALRVDLHARVMDLNALGRQLLALRMGLDCSGNGSGCCGRGGAAGGEQAVLPCTRKLGESEKVGLHGNS